jgi:hypothetical protein
MISVRNVRLSGKTVLSITRLRGGRCACGVSGVSCDVVFGRHLSKSKRMDVCVHPILFYQIVGSVSKPHTLVPFHHVHIEGVVDYLGQIFQSEGVVYDAQGRRINVHEALFLQLLRIFPHYVAGGWICAGGICCKRSVISTMKEPGFTGWAQSANPSDSVGRERWLKLNPSADYPAAANCQKVVDTASNSPGMT